MRNQRFRIRSLALADLKPEAERIFPSLDRWRSFFLQGQLSAAEFAFAVFKTFYEHRKGPVRRARLNRPLEPSINGHEFIEELNNFSWLGMSTRVNRAWLWWLSGDPRFVLTEQIPSPRAMLEIQAQGRRYVSVLIKREFLEVHHEEKFDSYALLLHDLLHAERFFHPLRDFDSQVAFNKLLWEWSFTDDFKRLESAESELLHYLMSDMNAHPMHGTRYLFGMIRRTTKLDQQEKMEILNWWEKKLSQSEKLGFVSRV